MKSLIKYIGIGAILTAGLLYCASQYFTPDEIKTLRNRERIEQVLASPIGNDAREAHIELQMAKQGMKNQDFPFSDGALMR